MILLVCQDDGIRGAVEIDHGLNCCFVVVWVGSWKIEIKDFKLDFDASRASARFHLFRLFFFSSGREEWHSKQDLRFTRLNHRLSYFSVFLCYV
jgi:hypothetical protein